MKKSIIISAIALSLSVGAVYASPKYPEGNRVEKVNYKANSFCVSIALGYNDIVERILTLGEDPNEVSNEMTPAMYAAKYNRTEILKLLISYGADLEVKNHKKMTAATYAKIHGAKEAALIIEQALSEKKK